MDTTIILHLSYIVRAQADARNIAIRATDTDVFVILIHHISNMEAKVWIEVGLNSNNTGAFLIISKLEKDLRAAYL